jgi:hypothetical protein
MLPQLLDTVPPDVPLKTSGFDGKLELTWSLGTSAKLASVSAKLIAKAAGTTVSSLSVFIIIHAPDYL